jgi:hypothetical protein
MARDRLLSHFSPEVAIRLIGTVEGHGDRFSVPTTHELAALLIGGLSPDVSSFDIVVQAHTSEFQHVSPIHPALMSLQYPLLFPYGDVGYHTGIKLKETDKPIVGRDMVSMLEFYAYYMHYRRGEPNPILCSGRLSQQFQVNSYSYVEANRLTFFLFNQDLLRCETYQGISDAIGKGASTGKDVGIKKMLPASHTGSKRYMQQNFHDCMAICRVYGPPDKFTTFTCNSKWPEIVEALRFEPGQRPTDRSDMVVRVFHMKLDEYRDDIKEGHVFGPVSAGNSVYQATIPSLCRSLMLAVSNVFNQFIVLCFILQLLTQMNSKSVAYHILIFWCGNPIQDKSPLLRTLISISQQSFQILIWIR